MFSLDSSYSALNLNSINNNLASLESLPMRITQLGLQLLEQNYATIILKLKKQEILFLGAHDKLLLNNYALIKAISCSNFTGSYNNLLDSFSDLCLVNNVIAKNYESQELELVTSVLMTSSNNLNNKIILSSLHHSIIDAMHELLTKHKIPLNTLTAVLPLSDDLKFEWLQLQNQLISAEVIFKAHKQVQIKKRNNILFLNAQWQHNCFSTHLSYFLLHLAYAKNILSKYNLANLLLLAKIDAFYIGAWVMAV